MVQSIVGFKLYSREKKVKKYIAMVILIALVAAGAFALNITRSAGVGLLLDYSGNNGGYDKAGGITEFFGLRNMSFGGFAFFDISYVELGLSLSYGALKLVNKISDSTAKITISADFGSAIQLGIIILGKYPIPIRNSSISYFPLFGIDYNWVLSAKDPDGYKYDALGFKSIDFSQFGLLGGAGIDFIIAGNTFLRAEGLLHLRFTSKFMKDFSDALGFKTTLGIGPQIKVAFGGRF